MRESGKGKWGNRVEVVEANKRLRQNFSFISEFTTPHGRVRRSQDTGLRPVNQRKLAKAIRRAIGLGLHPSVHKHPELLVRDTYKFYEQNVATTQGYRS